MIEMKPYQELYQHGAHYRIFEGDVSEIELVWHRDETDRKIHVIMGHGWKIQYDNELPVELKEGDTFDIEKMKYHRIHRGVTGLVLRIDEREG